MTGMLAMACLKMRHTLVQGFASARFMKFMKVSDLCAEPNDLSGAFLMPDAAKIEW